jgi:hypothetical protein
MAATMAKKPSQQKGAPSPTKARQILHDQEVRGHPLTKAQRGYFGAVAAKARKGAK